MAWPILTPEHDRFATVRWMFPIQETTGTVDRGVPTIDSYNVNSQETFYVIPFLDDVMAKNIFVKCMWLLSLPFSWSLLLSSFKVSCRAARHKRVLSSVFLVGVELQFLCFTMQWDPRRNAKSYILPFFPQDLSCTLWIRIKMGLVRKAKHDPSGCRSYWPPSQYHMPHAPPCSWPKALIKLIPFCTCEHAVYCTLPIPVATGTSWQSRFCTVSGVDRADPGLDVAMDPQATYIWIQWPLTSSETYQRFHKFWTFSGIPL